jgi:hypothetical protein
MLQVGARGIDEEEEEEEEEYRRYSRRNKIREETGAGMLGNIAMKIYNEEFDRIRSKWLAVTA